MSSTPTLLAEGDLELIDALQLRPRASWTELGEALGVDPVTAARRWQRLEASGAAWTSSALGPRLLDEVTTAFLEVDCDAGAAAEVARALGRQRHLPTVQLMAGTWDIWAFAVSASQHALSQYVFEELPRVPGVRKVRTSVATRVYAASQTWRLHLLAPEVVARLRSGGAGRPRPHRIDDLDRQLFATLTTDGRAGAAELAAATGATPRTVQRRLSQLLSAGDLDIRVDLARRLAGWGAAAVLSLDMPDDLLDPTGRELVRWPETRTCAAVAGAHNMLFTVGLHTVGDLHAVVGRLRRRFPQLRVVDRQVVMQQTKLYGRLLDRDGRSTAVVPVDPWSLG